MPAALSELLTTVRTISANCHRLNAPYVAGLLAHIADDAETGGPAADLLAPWARLAPDAMQQALPALRLTAALNELALSGDDPDLAAHFPRPDRPIDPDAAWPAARAAMLSDPERLAAFMTHEPQTNEVARAAMLLGGFLEATRATGLPLRCFEIGASAGLNLNWDRFHYRLGDLDWGDPQSAVRLAPDWSGAPLTPAAPTILSRAACDRRPIDVSDPADVRRLLAYVWPDQFDRVARLKAAIQIAQAAGTTVEAADAVEWTRARAAPADGTLTVVYHSIFMQYLTPGARTALADAVAAHGARATTDAPFAWLRMEPSLPRIDGCKVRLTLWPGGEERLLGDVHPHGAWARWHG
jgi:hypothetical protein